MRGSLPGSVFFLVSFLATAGDGEAVRVRLLDADGRPAAGADVARIWLLKDGTWLPRGQGGRTDAGGRLEILEGKEPAPECLAAFDMARRLGAVFPTHPGGIGDREARLSPLVPVPLRLRWQEGDGPVDAFGADVYRMPEEACFMKVRAGSEGIPLALPAGEYRLVVYGCRLETRTVDFTLPGDAETLRRDGVRLVPSRLARLVGKELPAWSVTEARGVEARSVPADFRGKWLMVVVWGFW